MVEMKSYEPSLKELLQKEIYALPFGECVVNILDLFQNDPTQGSVCGCFGFSESGKPVVDFYTKSIENEWNQTKNRIIKRYSSKEKWIQMMVRHEYRHYQQYQYFESIYEGYYEYVFNLEQDFKYGEGPLEQDARDFSYGMDNDLAQLAAKYPNPMASRKKEVKKGRM